MKNYLLLFFCCSTMLLSCTQTSKKTNKQQLLNNTEIAKAKQYFSAEKDSLKLKALCFLIDNMDGKYGMDQHGDSSYTEYYHKVFLQSKEENFDARTVSNSFSNEEEKMVEDIDIIDSHFLIENVEYAFKAWEYPWARHLSFDEFCRYILPYRLKNEPLSSWRKYLFEKLTPLTDSLLKSGMNNPVEVCKILNNYVMHNFQWVTLSAPLISITNQFDNPVGVCNHRLFYTAAVGRAMGLPIAIDFVTQYPRWPGNHEWNVLTNDGKNKIVAFSGGDAWSEFPFYGLKMYRYVFENIDVPEVFATHTEQLKIIDVTTEYPFPCNDLVFNLKGRVVKNDVYLFAFGIGLDIVPMAVGEVQGDKLIFRNIVANQSSMIVLAEYDRGKLKYIENPVELKPNMDFKVFDPSKELVRKVKLYRKYTIDWEIMYYNKIKGVKIQGANKKDFSDAVTLFVNDSIPHTYYEMLLTNNVHYDYYRYLPKDSASINVAELHFMVKEKGQLGRVSNYIVATGKETENSKFACDDDITTNYNSEDGDWLGVDVSDKPDAVLSQVNVLARNNLNNISINNEYELFYFDKQWISLGVKTADKYYIEFERVPYNSLLLLKNHTTGRQERIFTYHDGKQDWW